jgi:hypothetical protein
MTYTSPYADQPVTQWHYITDKLISQHPIGTNEIRETVLKAWNDIFYSKIGSFYIGKEIEPSPQIMSFFLHELVAHYLSLRYKGLYKVGVEKGEKDIHCLSDEKLSIEIKASSHPSQIFANRSYAQPQSGGGQKDKNGYYIIINFEPFKIAKPNLPRILLIRFGYIEHSDWIAQKAATGQQARLSVETYRYKLRQIYP